MNRFSQRAALGLTLLSLACTGGPGPSDAGLAVIPDSPATLTIEVGTGSTEWEPLNDGDVAHIIAGPQGGFHVWTSIHVEDSSVALARVNLSTVIAVNGQAAGPPSSVATDLSLTAGLREKVGMRNFIADPANVRGTRVILRAEAVTNDGRHGAGQRVVLLQ